MTAEVFTNVVRASWRFVRGIVGVLVLAGLWVASADSAMAAESSASLEEVVATLEQGYRLLEDLQADFTQRTSIATVKRDEKGHGELFMKRVPGSAAMFRFNYAKPRQQIVANGKKVWYYLPENRQVLVGDMASLFESGNSVALTYLTGMGNVSADFTVSFSGDGRNAKGDYQLDLVPKKPSQLLKKLQLTISAEAVAHYREKKEARDPFPILSSVVHDQMGNRTTIDYSKVKVNQGMSTGKFSFKVPAGVEVIKNH